MQHEITLICDDIRYERGNKISLVGLYDEVIVFPRLPARLAKLCVFQRWADGGDVEKILFEIRGAPLGDAAISAIPRRTEPKPGQLRPSAKIKMLLLFAPVDVVAEGKIRFEVYFNDEATPRHVHSIEVRVDPNVDRLE